MRRTFKRQTPRRRARSTLVPGGTTIGLRLIKRYKALRYPHGQRRWRESQRGKQIRRAIAELAGIAEPYVTGTDLHGGKFGAPLAQYVHDFEGGRGQDYVVFAKVLRLHPPQCVRVKAGNTLLPVQLLIRHHGLGTPTDFLRRRVSSAARRTQAQKQNQQCVGYGLQRDLNSHSRSILQRLRGEADRWFYWEQREFSL